MNRKRLHRLTVAVLFATVLLDLGVWGVQTYTYAKQDLGVVTMLEHELSPEMPEWRTALWLLAYLVAALVMAAYLNWAPLERSTGATFGFAVLATALTVTGFAVLPAWMFSIASIPSILLWALVLVRSFGEAPVPVPSYRSSNRER